MEYLMLPEIEPMLVRLKLRHFRLLSAIEEHGSLLKAANAVAISQPGATKALQEIEQALGHPLFLRTNRGLQPNELGHCVVRYARLILQDMVHLREEMIGILDGHGGPPLDPSAPSSITSTNRAGALQTKITPSVPNHSTTDRGRSSAAPEAAGRCCTFFAGFSPVSFTMPHQLMLPGFLLHHADPSPTASCCAALIVSACR
jgi:molybdate transport repressor ModE-like protein